MTFFSAMTFESAQRCVARRPEMNEMHAILLSMNCTLQYGTARQHTGTPTPTLAQLLPANPPTTHARTLASPSSSQRVLRSAVTRASSGLCVEKTSGS